MVEWRFVFVRKKKKREKEVVGLRIEEIDLLPMSVLCCPVVLVLYRRLNVRFGASETVPSVCSLSSSIVPCR